MAVIHVVLIQWRGDTTAAQLERARSTARGMANRIPGIDGLNEGPSVSPEGLEQGHDYALVIRFSDTSARDRYLPHPVHQELVEQIREHAVAVTVFDLEGASS